MKFLKKVKRVYILSFVFILVLIILVATFYKHPLPVLVSNIKMAFLRSDFFEKSTVTVSLDENYLNIKFHILDKDKKPAETFLSKAGISKNVLSGISIELDTKTAEKLKSFLPLDASMLVIDKKLIVFSKNQKSLTSSELGREVVYATGEGLLKYKKISSDQFQMNFENPDVLLRESSISGKLHLSKKAQSLSTFLQNVSIINLEINGKNVSGEMILK